MSAVSLKLRTLATSFLAASIMLTSLSVSADDATMSATMVTSAPPGATATVVSNNPYRAKISAEFLLQLDPIVAKIFARGRNLSQANYVNYLTQISERMKALMVKPEYVSNTAIQNIIGYIDYEVSAAREYISAGKSFLGDLAQSMDDIYVANNGNLNPSPILSGRQSTAVTCANRGGLILALMAAPSDMNSSDADKTLEYRQYLTCIGGPDPVLGRYESNYGAPYGMVRNGGYLTKSDSMKEWENTSKVTVKYIYNSQAELVMVGDGSN